MAATLGATLAVTLSQSGRLEPESGAGLSQNRQFKAGPFENQNLQIDNNWLRTKLENKLKNLGWQLAKSDMVNFLLEGSLADLDDLFDSESMIQKANKILS